MTYLVVYEKDGTYYAIRSVGQIPAPPPYASKVFSVSDRNNDSAKLTQKARDEAARRGLGKVVNL